MFVSSRGTVGGLVQRSVVSRSYKPGSRKGVIVMAGWTASVDAAAEGVTSGVEDMFISRDIANAGFPTISCAGDSSWGNSTIRTSISTLKTNAQSALFATGKVHLWGISMGGLAVLNWAKDNPTLVQSIAVAIPCINPQRLYDDDPLGIGISASVDAAYEGRPADADTPILNAESFVDIPMKIWYSTTDTVSTVTSEMTTFASDTGAEIVSMGAVGHSLGAPLSVGGAANAEDVGIFFGEND